MISLRAKCFIPRPEGKRSEAEATAECPVWTLYPSFIIYDIHIEGTAEAPWEVVGVAGWWWCCLQRSSGKRYSLQP